MKEISEAALLTILKAYPNAKVEDRDGARVVVWPMYDFETDRSWIEERKIVETAETSQGIVPIMNVREGAKFNPGGEPKKGPLGQLYSIIGYTPPPKKDASD